MTEKKGGVAAVDRALTILDAFRMDDQPLTLHELAARTGFYKSTVLRLLVSLMRHGCIQQLQDGRYQLGYAVMHWGSVYTSSLQLKDVVVPILTNLAAVTGEGASFFRREGNIRLCLFRVDSSRTIRDHMHAGDILPLGTGAAGRVLVEFDPQSKMVSESPIIVTVGEREPDIAAIAAPVFGAENTLRGAVAISGPSARFTDSEISSLSSHVLKAAVELTLRFGGDTSKLSSSKQ
jgi:DNA-binding IclR family transcriptional regulator